MLQFCPVGGAVSFIDSWGFPRSGGRRHKGVDMMASTGTPVVAPVGGTVSHRSNSVGGRSFRLNGNDGNYYYGTHMWATARSGSVSAGAVIGYVGDGGNAAGHAAPALRDPSRWWGSSEPVPHGSFCLLGADGV